MIRIPIVITNDQDYYSTDKGKALNRAWSSHLERFRKLYPTALVMQFKKRQIILSDCRFIQDKY